VCVSIWPLKPFNGRVPILKRKDCSPTQERQKREEIKRSAPDRISDFMKIHLERRGEAVDLEADATYRRPRGGDHP